MVKLTASLAGAGLALLLVVNSIGTILDREHRDFSSDRLAALASTAGP